MKATFLLSSGRCCQENESQMKMPLQLPWRKEWYLKSISCLDWGKPFKELMAMQAQIWPRNWQTLDLEAEQVRLMSSKLFE